jgi:hypothetical protein
MIRLVLSIATLCIVSSALALPLSNNWLNFLSYFFSFTVVQIIGYNIYQKWIELKIEKLQNERIKEYSKQGLEIKCPCPKEKEMFVPIELNSDNYFKCAQCDKKISVQITAKSFLETQMVDLDTADAALVDFYKKIKENK